MAFLALNMNVISMIQQKSSLEYQEMSMANQAEYYTQQLTSYLDGGGTAQDPYAENLQVYSNYYTTKQNSIESRLKILNATLEATQKAVTDNIKNGMKLSISG